MPTVTKKKTPRRTFVDDFKEWLTDRSSATFFSNRQGVLRDRLLRSLESRGEEDEKGNLFLDLPEAVEHEETAADGKKKQFVYTMLKREKRVSKRVPDADATEELLRKKNLWLSVAQEEIVRQLQIALPNVTINVDPDIDAVSALYLKKVISEKEYESILTEEKVSYAFIPLEEG